MGASADDFTTVDAWTGMTSNFGGEYDPDLWTDREASLHSLLASGRVGPVAVTTSRADAHPGRVVVDVRVVSAGSVPTPGSIAPYWYALVVSRYEIVNMVEGRRGQAVGDRATGDP